MKILQILTLLFSIATLANAQTAVLTGSVYDAVGAVIVNSKVTAVNQKGEKFEAVTNSEGVYSLKLPVSLYNQMKTAGFRVARYDIFVAARGFEEFVLKDFKFVPSYTGKMNLDIASDIAVAVDTIDVGLPKKTAKRKTRIK